MPSMPSAPPPDTLSGPTHTLTDLAALLRGRRFTVLTGAGCSTESGIPDYRGPETRRRARNPIQGRDFLRSAEIRRRYWARALVGWERFRRAEPNAAHHALASLDRAGLITRLITQNVDGLHQAAGNDPETVIEVHGTMRVAMCWSCGLRWPMGEILDRVRLGEDDPPCEACGGIIKSDTISFGQNLVPAVIDRAFQAAADADLLLAIGSTLQVYPVAGVVPVAKRAGARIVIVNAEPTGMDELADELLTGQIGEVLPAIVP